MNSAPNRSKKKCGSNPCQQIHQHDEIHPTHFIAHRVSLRPTRTEHHGCHADRADVERHAPARGKGHVAGVELREGRANRPAEVRGRREVDAGLHEHAQPGVAGEEQRRELCGRGE